MRTVRSDMFKHDSDIHMRHARKAKANGMKHRVAYHVQWARKFNRASVKAMRVDNSVDNTPD